MTGECSPGQIAREGYCSSTEPRSRFQKPLRRCASLHASSSTDALGQRSWQSVHRLRSEKSDKVFVAQESSERVDNKNQPALRNRRFPNERFLSLSFLLIGTDH